MSNRLYFRAYKKRIVELEAALAAAEQERDELAERVIAFCARMGGHVDESQQRHPTWRGVTT